MKDLFDNEPSATEAIKLDELAVERDAGAVEDAGLSDLDRALAHWAARHGTDALVARAFALASWAVSQGHTCLALDAIPTALMSAANQQVLPAALDASPLVGEPGESRPLIVDHGRLYLQRYHAYETKLAKCLRELMVAAPDPVDIERLKPGRGLFEADIENPSATNWQTVAAFAALRHRFTVISGGPGTGKTFTVVRLLRVLIEAALAENRTPPLVALAAPTGKAAARMIESVRFGLAHMTADRDDDSAAALYVPDTARTLHRLLGLTGATTQPCFNADNPLPYDVVIVDESSMVDLPMMAKLVEAIADGARLILLGDRYQLASVESGSVLAEICANAGVNRFTAEQQTAADELIAEPAEPAPAATPAATPASSLADHVVTLQTSRRFNADSTIGRLAAAANAGDVATARDLLTAGHHDLVYHDSSDAVAISRLMDRLADDYAALNEATDPALALAQLGRQCVLTAVRRGPAGSETLNAGITERLARRFDFNPTASWYHGRPVMVRRNDYRTGLYNGDVGVALRSDQGQVRVWFQGDNGMRAFLPSALPEHDTVYAMTIHKSQGSEFYTVTLVLPDYDVPVLTRELFYTGLTRGREKLVVYASNRVLQDTIARRVTRVSGLAERITDAGVN